MLTLTIFDESAQEEMVTGPSIIPRTMPGSRGEHDLQEPHCTGATSRSLLSYSDARTSQSASANLHRPT